MPVPTPIDGRPFLSLSPRGGPSLVPVRASVDPRHRDEVALVVVEDRAKAAWCSQPTDRIRPRKPSFTAPSKVRVSRVPSGTDSTSTVMR
jgi:hypothetical protein